MGELFNRRMTLEVTTKTVGRSWFFRQSGDLSFSFSVERTAGIDPNGAEVRVWNLNQDARRLVSDDGATMRLSAGYEGTEALIFSGDVDDVLVSKDGDEILTVVTCSDGGRALRSTVANISTSKDTPVSDVIDELVETLGLARGSVASVTGALKQGMSALAPARQLLDEVCRSNGLRVSVQDGVAQVHVAGGTPESIVVLSKESGLVGAPERLVERDQQGDAVRIGARFRSLLQPGIRPGRRIRLVSDWVSGDFVVERCSHSGSTFGGEWYTEGEVY